MNIYTCDGKAMCLSNKLIESMKFPKDKSKMGNVDHYIYFLALINNFQYRYIPSAVHYFRCPTTVSDFVKWQERNYKANHLFKETFTSIANKEYKIPKIIFNYFKLREFFKNPLGSIFILFLGLYCYYSNRKDRKYSAKWDLVKSTKELNI